MSEKSHTNLFSDALVADVTYTTCRCENCIINYSYRHAISILIPHIRYHQRSFIWYWKLQTEIELHM
jgi:hypothetical protein